ncbi:RIR1 reductase, partial [Pterocles burchelli]|nr:RIR1 reductase [Pterocles burchelli]
MPTASTAQILGNNESIEPYTSNIYTRRVLSGEFQVVNPHLLKDLTERGLWNEEMKNQIIAHNGSIQVRVRNQEDGAGIPAGPGKAGWGDDLPPKVCSIPTSLWGQCGGYGLREVGPTGLADSSSQAPAFSPQGLKTGMYYLRTKPAANPIQFTLNKEKLREREKASREEEKERNKAAMVCSLENRDECMMCGS